VLRSFLEILKYPYTSIMNDLLEGFRYFIKPLMCVGKFQLFGAL